jgi:RimJ/RimL family protein N-acetyltransferase
VVEFALTELALNRIYALQLERHPLAARVLSTVGMQREGLVRKRVLKGGMVEDIVCLGDIAKRPATRIGELKLSGLGRTP